MDNIKTEEIFDAMANAWAVFYKENGEAEWNPDLEWDSETVGNVQGELESSFPDTFKDCLSNLLVDRESAWRATLLAQVESKLQANFKTTRVYDTNVQQWMTAPGRAAGVSFSTWKAHWFDVLQGLMPRKRNGFPVNVASAVRRGIGDAVWARSFDNLCVRTWDDHTALIFMWIRNSAEVPNKFEITLQREECVTGTVLIEAASAEEAEQAFIEGQDASGVVWNEKTRITSKPGVLDVKPVKK